VVGPTQDRILRVARSVGVATQPVRISGKSILISQGKRSTYAGTLPSLHLLAKLDFNHLLRETDRLAEDVHPERPWESRLQHLDQQTVNEWLMTASQTEAARALYADCLLVTLCKTPAEVSMLYWLFYVAAGGGMLRLLETDNGAQERKFLGGAQQISERLAARLDQHGQTNLQSGTPRVLLGHAVSKIVYGSVTRSSSGYPMDDRIELSDVVEITCSNGAIFRARCTILAVSPSLHSRIDWLPALPPVRQQLVSALSMGCLIKTNVRYKRPFWHGTNEHQTDYSGSIITDEGPINFTFDDCHTKESATSSKSAESKCESASTSSLAARSSSSASPVPSESYGLMGFFLADTARHWMQKTRAERQLAVCQQYAAAFKNAEALEPIEYIEQNWSAFTVTP
jgi:monoamine oxidase